MSVCTLFIVLLCCAVLCNRSRLILSESLARQNPQSPFRRAPSSILYSTADGLSNTDELLKIAKDNIESLKMRGRQVGYYLNVYFMR